MAIKLVFMMLAACAIILVRASTNNTGAVNDNSSAASSQAEKHDESKRTDLGIAVMLLGGVSFMMAIFYLVNHADSDVKRYSWRVLSATISIFCAVLIFQACNGVIEYYFFTKGTSHWFELLVDMLHGLVWLAVLQAVLSYLTGFFGGSDSTGLLRLGSTSSRSISDRSISRTEHNLDIEKFDLLKINMKTTGVLLGHTTGFAAINAWGTLQRIAAYEPGLPHPTEGRGFAFCSIVLAVAGMMFQHTCTKRCRLEAATWDDGELDAIELLGHEEIKEIENDVFGLTISFLTVEFIRFIICGKLPSDEEEEPSSKDEEHSRVQVMSLCLMGCVFGACVFAHVKRNKWLRTHNCFKIVWAMSFAWCFYYALQWLVFESSRGNAATNSVIASLLATTAAFSLMRVLDWMADKQDTDAHFSHGARAIIESLGILVGFSWEKSFDVAVDSVAEGADESFLEFLPQPVLKLGLAFGLCLVVLPAWRWYILPTEMELEEECEESALEVERSITEESVGSRPLLDRQQTDVEILDAKQRKRQAAASLRKLRCDAKAVKLKKTYDDLADKKKQMKKMVEATNTKRNDIEEASQEVGSRDAPDVTNQVTSAAREENEQDTDQPMCCFREDCADSLAKLNGRRMYCDNDNIIWSRTPTDESTIRATEFRQNEAQDTQDMNVLNQRVNSLREEIISLKTSMLARGREDRFRSPSRARSPSPPHAARSPSPSRPDAEDKDSASRASRAGTRINELSLQLADIRRGFQEKADHCCEMERDVSLLRVELSATYRNFWSSQRYPRYSRDIREQGTLVTLEKGLLRRPDIR